MVLEINTFEAMKAYMPIPFNLLNTLSFIQKISPELQNFSIASPVLRHVSYYAMLWYIMR